MTADGSDRSFGAPRFDVVLRGYDRRQVDEHISRLQRLMGRMRNDLDAARSQPVPPAPAGGRVRPTPRPRPDGMPATGGNDVVGTFTDRMHAILQAAEEEAAEIRRNARAAVRAEEERAGGVRASTRAEEETARRNLVDLVRQRDAVLAELTRVRGQLEALLSGPTARITLPTQEGGPERREPGAGQPLPGTPGHAGSSPAADHPAGPGRPSAPFATHSGAPTGTPVFRPPNGTGSQQPPSEPSRVPDESAAERTAVLTPAERTALMDSLADESGDAAPQAEPARAEETQFVPLSGSAPREGKGSAAPEPATEEPGETDDAGRAEQTQAAPASPVRSG
jgi:hypothetical protein